MIGPVSPARLGSQVRPRALAARPPVPAAVAAARSPPSL